ncbi:4'-phosphopantetheinyl transferase family protein [Arenimonas sp. MALMAid1274]|uniref:4'-phosphopantetheinyl transferase family protein n=1 Tax=Arenimonas sp. MALMAid1274 TaxID=3411630 RepID=UPI003BA1DA83
MSLLLELTALSRAPAEPGWLAEDERARAASLGDALRGRQFLAGHSLARRLAAELAGGDPWQWRLEVADDQRRVLRRSGADELGVSISHAGDSLAVVVATRPVGIDIESTGRGRDWLALGRTMFSPEENEALRAAGPDALESVFLRTWTLKEAWSKRSGRGLQRQEARRCGALPAAPAEAEARHWVLPGGRQLSLAAWPGAELRAPGLPAAAGHWSYRERAD